jgi:hypothetical protein
VTAKGRWLVLAVISALVLTGAVAFGVTAFLGYQQRSSASSPVDIVEASPMSIGPRVVFRNTGAGQGYGMVASVPLDDPAGRRTVWNHDCDRVYASHENLACLRIQRGIATTFEAVLYDKSGAKQDSWALPGIPSRTRISPDSHLVASTAFVTGMSYATVGFSTQTVIRGSDGRNYGNLEDFTTLIDGATLTAADRNFWGVTFGADDNTFYATAASGGHTWLVRGDLAARTLTSVHPDAECPSLSPDGRRVAYKKNVATGAVSHWAIAVLDLGSGEEHILGESRSVDDQVEWLDNATLLYGLLRSGEAGDSDVWSIGVDGSVSPALYIEHAWSPSVVRE